MGTKKKVEEIDLVVDPTPLTKEEKQAISDFIKADKLKAAKKKRSKRKGRTTTKSEGK